ncbi:MAG: FprA family A-type flavoprotein [Candidatus Omnitrophica bacterium]|nr:FprA family A-type flavoprotein [Candidatus Omnitrophota bacterium]
MIIREIKKGVYGIIMNDWSRRLFDELIPLPDGTTYNAYFIKDEKNVLIDTSDPVKADKFLSALKSLGIEKIDYVVSNHSEQDHSGSIPMVLEQYPGSKVMASEKGADFLKKLLLVPETRCVKVENEEIVSIGGRKLKFFHMPWVHWPETIVTYDIEDKMLFPCDLFGSHLAASEFYSSCNEKIHESAKRYYAEIMMPFRSNIKKHLEVLKKLDIEIIAPSHGPVYDKPGFIMEAYEDWTSDRVKNEVVLPYVSMHGSVAKMVDFFADSLIKKGIAVKPYNLTGADIGELAIALVDAATMVLGTPTVLSGPHPSAVYAAYLFKILRPKTRFVSIIGSFGWGGSMVKSITEMMPSRNIEILEPVVVNGYPLESDFNKLENLAETIAEKHKQLNLLK